MEGENPSKRCIRGTKEDQKRSATDRYVILIVVRIGYPPVQHVMFLHCLPTTVGSIWSSVFGFNTVTGGPDAGDRAPFCEENQLTEIQCREAIALMKHTTDEAIIKEKMKQTFKYRQGMVHDPVKSSEVFTTFTRFLDTTGMVCSPSTALP